MHYFDAGSLKICIAQIRFIVEYNLILQLWKQRLNQAILESIHMLLQSAQAFTNH